MKKAYCLLSLLLIPLINLLSQENSLLTRLNNLGELQVKTLRNEHFKAFYEISFLQPVNQEAPQKEFSQRFFLGMQDLKAPTVLVTEGYAADYAAKADYSNELARELGANLLVAEHRFSGKSVPDSLDWSSLTLKQAAMDYHRIKQLLDTILTGNWIATGISKGGQAALAYKLYYPEDVQATVVYGAAVKSGKIAISDSLLRDPDRTPCGQNIRDIQSFAFRNKKQFLSLFSDLSRKEQLRFSPDPETILDYILLELPFSFWQNGHSCAEMPDSTSSIPELFKYITHIVPPAFFTVENTKKLEASFYMFYHELGYYEYGTEQFKFRLKDSSYSNRLFAPAIPVNFDYSYQNSLLEFLENTQPADLFFVYGEQDPWALQNVYAGNIFVIPAGSHKSRVSDLPGEKRALFYKQLKMYAGIKSN
ncbi:MAG: S28 family serine protease [Bacteroidota bacterium]